MLHILRRILNTEPSSLEDRITELEQDRDIQREQIHKLQERVHKALESSEEPETKQIPITETSFEPEQTDSELKVVFTNTGLNDLFQVQNPAQKVVFSNQEMVDEYSYLTQAVGHAHYKSEIPVYQIARDYQLTYGKTRYLINRYTLLYLEAWRYFLSDNQWNVAHEFTEKGTINGKDVTYDYSHFTSIYKVNQSFWYVIDSQSLNDAHPTIVVVKSLENFAQYLDIAYGTISKWLYPIGLPVMGRYILCRKYVNGKVVPRLLEKGRAHTTKTTYGRTYTPSYVQKQGNS